MANYAATQSYLFQGAGVSGGQLTFANSTNTIGGGTITDADNSDTASVGDYYISTLTVYSQYTVEIGGEVYALYVDAIVGTNWQIPHQGELLSFSPSGPLNVTFAPTAMPVNCFAGDTMIRTPSGERQITELRPGDTVTTADWRSVEVLWVARNTLQSPVRISEAQTVRISAGALGRGVPNRDLTVTGDHALAVDGVLVHASALVNGTTICFVPVAEQATEVTFYHIETADHELLLANGAPTESFINYATRSLFDNYGEYQARHGADRIIREMDLPRITTRRASRTLAPLAHAS